MKSYQYAPLARRGGLALGALAAFAIMAGPAGALVVKDSHTGKKFGIVPTAAKAAAQSRTNTACNADNSDCTKLTYGGGPVQHAEKDYLLFWMPSGNNIPSAYREGMSTWLSEVAHYDYTAFTPLAVNQQYYDLSGPGGAKNFVPFAIVNGGSLIDTDPYPASGCTDSDAGGNKLPICLTDAQLASELVKYIAAHSLPTGLGTEYFIFTPYKVGTCFDSSSASSSCSYTGYCGYHSSTTTSSNQTVLYADMPWAYDRNGCDVNMAFGAGYANADGLDSVVGIFSHEASETMTDPIVGSGWTQSGGADNGDEIGDKCAYIYGSGGYGSLSGLSTNGLGYYNVTLQSDQYLMQMEFDNGGQGGQTTCEIKDIDSQLLFTISPTTATHGSSQTFTANFSYDPHGVAYISWSFGDGSATTTTTTKTVSHTYATAGTYYITAIATDNDGNETRVVQKITVS